MCVEDRRWVSSNLGHLRLTEKCLSFPTQPNSLPHKPKNDYRGPPQIFWNETTLAFRECRGRGKRNRIFLRGKIQCRTFRLGMRRAPLFPPLSKFWLYSYSCWIPRLYSGGPDSSPIWRGFPRIFALPPFCSICHFLLWRRRRKTLNSPYFPLFRAAEFPYILRFSTRFQTAKNKRDTHKNLLRALHRAGKRGVCVWWPLGPSNHPTLTFSHMLGNACFGGMGHDLKLKWGLFKCPLKSPLSLSLSPRKGRIFIIFRVATFGNPWSFFSNLSRRRKPSCMEHNFGNGGREKSSSRIRIWRH